MRPTLACFVLLSLFLVAACTPSDGLTTRPADEPDWTRLQVRIADGPAASVPAGLATEMQNWPLLTTANPRAVEVGRQLFFDPIMSSSDNLSCASCHHPDLGYADGRGRAIGVSGQPLGRSSMALWNVGYKSLLTWDGRASELANQMVAGPLFHPDEMGNDPAVLLAELQANPTYSTELETLYGAVTIENAAEAIAEFQRTLISTNTPVDRYAAGDFYALTGAQRRGFEIFRSNETNCAQCHQLPTFANEDFKIIGVSDDDLPYDPGRGAITGDPADVGAFAVPTLRNIALTAPYFHNGNQATLNGVISLYLNGGGDNLTTPRLALDPDLRSFSLNNRELSDLEAFLYALTDESTKQPIPESVPSGLPVVAPIDNPARALVAETNALPTSEQRTFTVRPGENIQDAIDRAHPGDTVILEAGDYYETLYIDVSDLTLIGTGATLHGRPFTPTGIVVKADNLHLVGLTITDFPTYTIDRQGGQGLRLENVILNGASVSAIVE